jgi:hypothetical protein
MTVTIRCFVGHELLFEETIDAEPGGPFTASIAEEHAKILAAHPLHTVEMEFLDEPPDRRFVRFGTDPSMMIRPQKLDLPN